MPTYVFGFSADRELADQRVPVVIALVRSGWTASCERYWVSSEDVMLKPAKREWSKRVICSNSLKCILTPNSLIPMGYKSKLLGY